jgi:hypothetical protein
MGRSTAQAQAAPEAPISGYGIVDLSGEVEVTPDNNLVFTGTVQSVKRQIVEVKPDAKLNNATEIARGQAAGRVGKTKLGKRDDVVCNNFPSTGWIAALAAAQGMESVSGQPTKRPGPGNCGQVACRDGATIWWCSDVSLYSSK